MIVKNIRLNGRKTSIQLEPEFWDTLNRIAIYRGHKVRDIAQHVYNRYQCSEPGRSFTSLLRVYILENSRDLHS